MSAPVLTEQALREAVAAAVRAPSLMNSQPWRFRISAQHIEVWADRDRTLPVADPNGWAMRIAGGAATFNLAVALAVQGCPAEVVWRPAVGEPDLLARLRPAAPRGPTPLEQRLYRAIPRRSSNRAPFWPQPVPASARAQLVEAAQAEKTWLVLVTGPVAVGAVAEIAHAANRVLERDPRYQTELRAWTRPDDSADDGVPSSAGGPSAEAHDLLPQRAFGNQARAPGRDFEPEPLVAVLGCAGDLPIDQLSAGYALQRVLLTATDLGLAVSMLSQPIEVAAAREQLRLALGRFGAPHMVLRIGYGQPGAPTPRRSLDDVIGAIEHQPPM
jgi:nitroreductase